MKALIIDDEKDICELLAEILKEDNIEVQTSMDAQQALKKLDQENFDVLLVDYSMPKMNGFEFIEKVKSAHPNKLPKFVLISGGSAAAPEMFEENKERGIDAVIPKPFQFEELLPQLHKLVGQ